MTWVRGKNMNDTWSKLSRQYLLYKMIYWSMFYGFGVGADAVVYEGKVLSKVHSIYCWVYVSNYSTALSSRLPTYLAWNTNYIFPEAYYIFFPTNRLIYLCIIKVEVTTFERLKGSDLNWCKHIKLLVYREMSW